MKKIINFLFLISIIFPQNENFEISNISVYGNIEMSEEDIINFSGLSPNSSINAINIQNAINRLWLLNRFENIFIDFDQNYDNINLIINVEEFPILNEAIFEGEYFKFKLFKFKKSKSELKKISDLISGTVLSPQKIKAAINLIKDDFIKRNYHNVKIEYDVTDSSIDNKKNILFNINAGSKSKIKDIQLILNGQELESPKISERIKSIFTKNNEKNLGKPQILKVIKKSGDIKKKKWYFPWTGHYDNQKLENMNLALISHYRNQGYLDFNISDYMIIDKNILLIKIISGDKYYINNIDFSGNYIFSDSIIMSNINFQNGDFYNGNKFDMSNLQLNNLYRDKGYLFSQIIPSFIPIAKDSLDINFDINEKSIVKINEIIIKGNDKTKENVIRRDIDIFPNQIFSQSDLMESYRRLAMLNYFESILPDIKPINEEEVDVIFELVEKGSGQLNFTAGYSGLYGFTGGGGFNFPNFLGTGQNVSLNYQRGISNQQSATPQNQDAMKSNQTFSMSYTEPRLFDTSNLIGISGSYQEQGQNSIYGTPFDRRTISGGIRFGKRFNWPDKFFKGSWSLGGSKRFYIAADSLTLASYYSSIADEIEFRDDQWVLTTSGLRLTQYITRDNRDHPEFPTQGSTFKWNQTLSGGLLGGNEDYYKNEFDFKFYNKIIDKLVVHQNFKMGSIIPIESSGNSIIPYSSRFKMGGSGLSSGGEMLRGYSENMIGPIGSNGYPKGGNYLLKYSLELRYLISENPNMYILIFGDAGNVWADDFKIETFSLRRSMGVGVRVMMPMLGILGYDIGYGFDPSVEEYLNENNDAHGWEYHFIFGLPIY